MSNPRMTSVFSKFDHEWDNYYDEISNYLYFGGSLLQIQGVQLNVQMLLSKNSKTSDHEALFKQNMKATHVGELGHHLI